MRRRSLLGAAVVGCLAGGGRGAAAALPTVLLGVLSFGTVQWVADVIRRHKFDEVHGLRIQPVILANNDGGRIALMAGSADIVVTDWPFVAGARGRGTPLKFAPFSSATGGIMVREAAPLHALGDLRGRRLGVAGGPLDKSWLIVQAAARARGDNLATEARLSYGAPPLLDAKLLQGQLDAVLTFWSFAARLETQGQREMISVADCAASLGLPRRLNLVGFAFHQGWAESNWAVVDGFLAAVADAEHVLATSATEWQAVRPLMRAPDQALFEQFRTRFLAGIAHPSAAEQEREAEAVLAVLLRVSGTRGTDGLSALPQGVFWRAQDAHT